MTKTINLAFDGYWLYTIGDTAKGSRICLVYRRVYKKDSDAVSLKKLIHIGESGGVRGRIENHEKIEEWEHKLQSEEILIFSFTPIENPDRERTEASLIFKHKPLCNNDYVNNFPFDITIINSSGKYKFTPSSFSINKTS